MMKHASSAAFFTVVFFSICNHVVLIAICKKLWKIDPGYCRYIQAPCPSLSHWLAITKRHRMFGKLVSNGEIFSTFPGLRSTYSTLWLASRWGIYLSLLVFLILAVFQARR